MSAFQGVNMQGSGLNFTPKRVDTQVQTDPCELNRSQPEDGFAFPALVPLCDDKRCNLRIHLPHTGSHKRRTLVVCIDGTSNQFGGRNTNVIELYHLLEKSDLQLTYYDSGIGTYAQPSWKSFSYWMQVIENKIDLAIAWNLEKIIIKAYSWLSVTYQPGDCIFLFGFSRGAYQVRALSAMIEKVGLIHKGNEAQIPFAYELYADPKSSLPNQGASTSRAERFKETFSRNVRVHFVGAWDTVSSVGFVRNKTLPMTTDGMTHVCHFRHALALDERRVKFLPEYAYGGVTEKSQSPTALAQKPAKKRRQSKESRDSTDSMTYSHPSLQPPKATVPKGDVKEVWFAGTHSDIGGGNVQNEDLDRSGPPLLWMLGEAIKYGLRVGDKVQTSKRWEWKNKGGRHNSLTWWWWPLECMPFKRLTYKGEQCTTRRSHAGKGRKVLSGQLLHGSLFLELDSGYTPRASARGLDLELKQCRTLFDRLGNWLENDILGAALVLVGDFKASKGQGNKEGTVNLENLKRLQELIALPGGRWTIGKAPDIAQLIEEIILEISHNKAMRATQDQLTGIFLDAGGKIKLGPLIDSVVSIALNEKSAQQAQARAKLQSDLSKMGQNITWHDVNGPQGDKLNAKEIGILCDTGEVALVYRKSVVNSVAFSPDNKYIVSGSFDQSVRIWDAATGKCIREMRGHTHVVWSVAVSPNGKLIASGSADKTIRIWDMSTGLSVGGPLEAHAASICSVAFSPDGTYLVSGSEDGTVRLWDTATRKCTKVMHGHSDWVRSVAVSPDGRSVASGSDDKTIRIWNVPTGISIGEPLKAHTHWVRSVVFSPNGKYIASGSYDATVRIWDTTTRKCIREMRGHTDWVRSVAVSSDGKLVASGSLDNSIRIWDVSTGATIGGPFKRHTGSVRSIMFSPDGKYLVSGSDDRTIRRWRLGALGISNSVSRRA